MLTRKHRAESSHGSRNERKYLLEKCRACLEDGEIPIFGANDISEDVTEFGNIKISKDDNLPQYLCEACFTLLEAAILFRKTAKQSDEVLRSTDYAQSGSEDLDSKQDDEDVKREYLELNYTSDSELDDFDRIKIDSEFVKNEYDSEFIKNEYDSEFVNNEYDFEFIKNEYDSELFDCNRIKCESKSQDLDSDNKLDDETTNYYSMTSEADTQESNDFKHFSLKSEGNEAENETIMIIVSDKDKQNAEYLKNKGLNNGEEITGCNEKSLMKVLPHQRECEVCHGIVLKSSYDTHLNGHREKFKETVRKRNIKVNCEFCGKKISQQYLKVHLKMHGTPEEQAERLVKCVICDRKFSARYFADHIKRVHSKKAIQNKTPRKNLTKKETTPPPFPRFKKCPVCDKVIKENEYKMHVERHSGPEKKYMCDKCGKEFKHASGFKTHLLTHGSELKYKCQFCPYKGLHLGLLKIHVRTHTGDYNYKCPECPGRFITKSNLSKHMQRHKGAYNFQCEQCGRSFFSNREVIRHKESAHTSTKNHICEICGKAYGHRDYMVSHQLKVHKREKKPRGMQPSYLRTESNHTE